MLERWLLSWVMNDLKLLLLLGRPLLLAGLGMYLAQLRLL